MTERHNGTHYSDKGGHRIRSEHWKRVSGLETNAGSLDLPPRSKPNMIGLVITSEKRKRRFRGGNSPKRSAGPGLPYKPLF